VGQAAATIGRFAAKPVFASDGAGGWALAGAAMSITRATIAKADISVVHIFDHISDISLTV